MHSSGTVKVTLSADDCLDLLRTKAIGRIAYTDRALPAIDLVSYAVVNGAVRLRSYDALRTALRDAVVALQTDDLDGATGVRWSVSCVGKVATVPGVADELVLEPTLISGWRTGPPSLPAVTPGAAHAS